MVKELSIKAIKKELMNALLEDMRIMTLFQNKGEKKTRDYVGTNICSCLDSKVNDGYIHADTYINFDVMKNKNCYDVFIQTKAHRDLVVGTTINCLDDISECIEEIVKEVYPFYRCYSDIPERLRDDYTRRNIRFVLSPKDAEAYEKQKAEEEKYMNK